MGGGLDDGRRQVPQGGRARDMRTGSIHLSVRSGSRSRGASASAAFASVTRTGADGCVVQLASSSKAL